MLSVAEDGFTLIPGEAAIRNIFKNVIPGHNFAFSKTWNIKFVGLFQFQDSERFDNRFKSDDFLYLLLVH